ncbi:MAM and LDL-receptor class A domain-containing protein 2 [Acipenser ruthenus]|uniref:MAM and LDL-receptor class A domain-containing protein 2 n=1 Tax=Acipenser ruthenus TaxID=7906 RepID=A0A662YPH3_ACIRT|nr:MAM and LDL-receptor class A domain-containing protein 2 [Acipenser ruthenus]
MNEVVHTSPTIGSNVEEIVVKNTHFLMWDIGGQESLRSSWNTYYSNTEFIILVVDSTDRERLSITKEELYRMLAHELLFSASASLSEQDIALDDIQFVGCSVKDHPPGTSHLSCDFEDGLCAWYQDKTDHFEWQRDNGDTAGISNHGPGYDHTTGNAEGTLTVYIKDYEGLRAIWNAKGNHGKIWLEAQVDYNSSSHYQIVIEGKHGHAMDAGSTSLDDIYIEKYLSCSDMALTTAIPTTMEPTQPASPQDCSFEQGLCNWQQETNDTFDWERQTGSAVILPENGPLFDHTVGNIEGTCGFETLSVCNYEQDITADTDWVHTKGLGSGPPADHTYSTDKGYFMAVFGDDLVKRQTAQLLSPEYTPTTESCVRFWYWLAADSTSVFSVHVMQNKELGLDLWALSGNPSQDWDVAQITVSSALHFRIVFKVQLDPAKGSFVALDDVTVAAGACPYTGSCDFEAHQCTWTNSQADDFDWIQANGHFSGPSVDHTTQTPEGKCNPSKPSTATQLMYFVLHMFLVLLLNLKS